MTVTINGNGTVDGLSNLTSGDLTVDTNTLYVDATNDRVGIGTSIPTSKLHVAGGNAEFDGQVTISNGLVLDKATENYIFHTDSMVFSKSGTGERMRIDSSGNVGINTTSPRAKVDVKTGDLIVRSASESTDATIYLGTPHTDTSALKTAIIAEGIGSYSRAKLHFCLDDTISNDTAYNGSISNARMTIESNGTLKFNSGYGSVATAYGCRAWVNFNGTGTVAIRASGNVSSITDRGTGRYTVNLTTAMPDVNYGTSTGVRKNDANEDNNMVVTLGATNTDYSTTAVSLTTGYPYTPANQDADIVCISVFR